MRISKKAFLLLLLIPLQLFAGKIEKFSFNNKGEFKIVQFTDTHFYLGGKQSQDVVDNINYIMKTEKPDLLVLTGDIVTGGNRLESWDSITALLERYNTPYAITFGNHDDEGEESRKELYEHLKKKEHAILMDKQNGKVSGTANYVLEITNNKSNSEKLLYCMDSRSYSTAKDKGVDGYGWFDRSQINWFAETNTTLLEKNQGAEALFFFHIPLPEYKEAFDHGEFRQGVRMEEECSPKINTGMFAEMVQQGNVKGMFVGHDHSNNYAAQLYGIAFCYGYFSGGNSYHDLPLRGARVILLEEGKSGFTSWLRRTDGKILYKKEFPHKEK